MTPLRARLMSPPNAVPDTGITMVNGWPRQARAEPVQPVLELPASIHVNVYPVTFSAHDRIIRTVCRVFDIRLQELMSERRNQWVAEARQVAMALTVRLTKYSLPKIGNLFDRDHTTVLHAVRKMRPHINAIDAHMPPESIMEWVSALKERLIDPLRIKAIRQRATHCRRGHLYDEANIKIRMDKGTRRCRACDQIRYEKRKALRARLEA
jgi:hypothetical protein